MYEASLSDFELNIFIINVFERRNLSINIYENRFLIFYLLLLIIEKNIGIII